MKLTVVGCGDAFGGAGRGNACFRVETGAQVVALDFGASALSAWRRFGHDPAEIDVVALSHLHGDHFGGLPFLLLSRQFDGPVGRPLRILGPPGTKAAVSAAMELFYPGVAARGWRFDWRVDELEAGADLEISGLRLRTYAMAHSDRLQCLGLKLADGRRTIAYSGDTGWTEELVGLARDCDLLILECASEAQEIPGHLHWPRLRANLSRLGARRVAVTHMGAQMRGRTPELEAAGLIPLDDGLVVDV